MQKYIDPIFAIVIGTRPDRKDQLNNLLKTLKVPFPVMTVDCDGYEIGKIKWVLENTKLESFIFLQDTVEVKDPYPFFLALSSQTNVSFCDYPRPFGCYLGKYTRKTLEKIDLPDVQTKEQSVDYEMKFHEDINKNGGFQTIGEDLHNVDNFVEKFGHRVMKIEGKYFIKYKTTWNRNQL